MTGLREFDGDVIVIARYRMTRTLAASATDAAARMDLRLQFGDTFTELGEPSEISYEIGAVFERPTLTESG